MAIATNPQQLNINTPGNLDFILKLLTPAIQGWSGSGWKVDPFWFDVDP